MLVSIVIPCKNEKNYIENCIGSFIKKANLDYDLEVLVIDGMSTDGTREIVAEINGKHANVKLIDNHVMVTPRALNLGLENAKGDYILIASAHSSFDENYIGKLLPYFEEFGADAVGGFMETKTLNTTAKTNSIIEVLSNKLGVGNSMFRVGVEKPQFVDTVPFGIYKKETFEEIDGYDERLIRNHDIELSKRLLARGKKILLVPEPKCYYYAREKYSELYKNNFRNGKWNLLTVFITKNLSSLSIRHFIPMLFMLSLLIPLIASIFYKPFIYLALASLVSYSMAIILVSFGIFRSTKNTNLIYLFFTFLTLHFSYGLGSLKGLFSYFNVR
ncbi:MAG: glycosyltransferase family 2 protein [Salibacteraceae bacterium]